MYTHCKKREGKSIPMINIMKTNGLSKMHVISNRIGKIHQGIYSERRNIEL